MIATLILEDIKIYTQRINRELSISQEKYSTHSFVEGYLINPYKQDVLYLVPVDILHKLPVAACWEDIELVVDENSAIRDEINLEVADEWKNYTSKERKEYICDTVFKDPAACNRVLAKYKQESLEGFDPQDNIDYRLSKLEQSINKLNYDWHLPNKKPSSYSMSKSILVFFKDWVENQRGWTVENRHFRFCTDEKENFLRQTVGVENGTLVSPDIHRPLHDAAFAPLRTAETVVLPDPADQVAGSVEVLLKDGRINA